MKNNTIDLKEIIAKDYINSKKTNIIKIKETLIKYIAIIGIIYYIGLSFGNWGQFILFSETNASNGQILSIRDKIRLERINICNNAFQEVKKSKNMPFYIRKKLSVISCAIRMHGVYIMESGTGKSEMCKTQNSCLGIKSYKNGYYGHNGFTSYNEEREIFAKKYFQFHYKKSPHTFIYGYMQKSGKYKWGWATGNRKSYVNLLNKIENNESLIAEYDYLYMTGKNK